MLLDLINIEKIRRAILYFGLLLAVLFVQNIILSHIPIFGVRAMIFPIVVIAIGFFEGGVWGGVFGLIMGLFCDMSLSGASILMTVLFPILGFASGMLSMFFVNKRFFSFFCICLAALLITALCQMFRFLVFTDTRSAPLFITGGLQTLWSLPFTIAIYHPCRAVSRLDLAK